ncbi:glycoside hydrolase family 3 C-terminal domain-containing protein [uncultured Pseudoflavonifractor sp.]|uniref:glycoside hydrolase family 3 C-terminal domain-containing protein n=1 Tax=uncultured Pseudoflavonifractor sp. TaxID=1221379 RepID=UPI0025EBA562|nr:glycoside hydrolase family 3 C-terminal domain-containing protein [uncultured Pseudoflavonifractor sp.]
MSAVLMLGAASPSAMASGEDGKWYTDFGSYEEEQQYASELNIELMAESMVLLKNANGTLPLDSSVKNVTVFGARSYEIFTGGTGSGGGSGDPVTLTDSLKAAGFNVNTRVQEIYENNKYTAAVAPAGMGTTGAITVDPPVSWLAPAESSYQFFKDAAIITLGRTAGEGNDIYTSDVPTHSDPADHVQSLDDNEKALIQYVKAQGFDKIIVLINSANAFECTPMEADKTADNLGVDAILWIGQPGNSGLMAVGQALNGQVNPSGRLVDIYPTNFKLDPTWQNAHTMTQVGEKDNSVYASATDEEPDASAGNVVEYEEGIYLGYKYYETRYADWQQGAVDEMFTAAEQEIFGSAANTSVTAEQWYDMSVLYPFGYGLSYTTFSQELVTTGDELAAAINAKTGLDDMVEVQARVTNTGSVAGKQVVQLYVEAPYTAGGIEKSAVSLASFAKTGLLQPGQSEVVTMRMRMGELASFDYNDANSNGYKGWEIEAGSYEFSLRTNSHDESDAITSVLTAKTTSLDNDSDANNNTPLSNGDEYDTLLNVKDYAGEAASGSQMKQMNRAEGFVASFPTPTTQAERVYSEPLRKLLAMTFEEQTAGTAQDETRYTTYFNSDNDKPTDPWYKTNEDIPETWTQAVAGADGTVAGRVDGKAPIQLVDMVGLDYWSTDVIPDSYPVEEFRGKTEAEAWDLFVNQLTWEEMAQSLHHGGFISPGYEALGKDQADDVNGPATVNAFRTTDRPDGTFWVCETNVASTWNTDLAYQQGVMFGNESLYLDCPGWYANGLNTHRSPFCGRNYEYYSQDGYQGGMIGSAVVAGVQSPASSPRACTPSSSTSA